MSTTDQLATTSDGVEERVVDGHALLGPFRQAVTPAATLPVGKIDRRRWPAFDRFHLDRLASPRPVL